nr:BTAD domain-containing putative transcriptional regulator [Petropleomorpha daqingensis]
MQRVLLGLLLTEADRSVSFDRIVEELWGDAPPADPEASLHTYVSRLRRALEPSRAAGEAPRLLLRTPAGYRLAVSPAETDAGRFAEVATSARDALAAGDPAAALAAADAALALWRGTVLEDAGDREFAVRARDRLEEQRLACREDRLAALTVLGRPAEAVADAEALVAEHPLRERPWVLLIDALVAAGRTADALARYTDVHRLLDDELGVTPGPALRAAQARALGAGDVPAPVTPAPPSLIGREREFGQLRALVAGLGRSGPRFVLIDGEAGIGKSRLAAELTSAAADDGARVAWGRCHEDDDSPALWPWQQIVSALGAQLPPAAPDEGAFAAFERVLTALVSASADVPVVVVLDDLHWADPASLRLLAFLAVELQHGPIAVLCTCRTGVRDAGLAQVRATLARTAGFVSLPLGPLAAEDTARLVRRVADGLDERAAADLHERSGGNPFFATELARVAGDAVPPGVRDVVDRRLARLPDDARSVLRLAAAAGERFDVGLLQRASGTDDDALLDALDAATEADLVRAAGPGRLAFAHALVRDSLLAEVPELRRARLHARLADALPDSADPFERAHHLVAGRPFTSAEQTVAACAAAATRAALDHAHETAARWWSRALDTDPSPELRQDLLLRAGTSMARAGSWAAAQRLLSDAIDSALTRGDTTSAGIAADQLSTIGGVWFPVEYETYPERLVERLEAVAASDDDTARVQALAALAMYCHYGPDRHRGLREAARGLAVARRTGRTDLLVTALLGQLAAAWLPGHEQELIDAATELLELIDERERPEMVAVALARRGVTKLALGDVDGNDADLARAWEVTEQHALPLVSSQLISLQAARAMLDGSYEVAMELIDRAWAVTQRTQLYTQARTDLVMRAFVWIDQGCLPERLAELATDAMTTEATSGTLLITALALLQAGQPAAAAAAVAAEDGLEPYPLQWDSLSITCWQALIAAELNAEQTVCAAIAERLLPFADQIAIHGGIGALGPVGVFLGMVEAGAGQLDPAERHLRQAIDTTERLGLRPALVRGRLALAGVLAARGERSAAAGEAAAAREVAEEIGMRLLARRAARLAHE